MTSSKNFSGYCKFNYIIPLILLNTSFAWTKSPSEATIDSLIASGIALSIAQKYQAATLVFEKIKKDLPDSPAGYFFHAAVLQTRMMDLKSNDDEKNFTRQLDSALVKARNSVRKKQDAWAYFYLGSAYGYLAFYQTRQQKYLEAYAHKKV